MRAPTKTALHAAAWVSAGLLVVGVAAGTAEALSGQATSPGAATAARAATATATGALAAAAGPARPGQARPPAGPARLLRRALHGELTLRTKHGYQTLAIQRGKLTTVDTTAGTVVVTSLDGFSATYAVRSSTKVLLDRRPVALSALKTGDRVVVIAVQTANGLTARRLGANDQPPRAARPTPGGSAPGSSATGAAAPAGFVAG